MHIVFLSTEYPTKDQPEGGLANYLKNIGSLLIKHGNNVTIFVLSKRNFSWKDGDIYIEEVKNVSLNKYFLTKWCRNSDIYKTFIYYLSTRHLASKVFSLHNKMRIDIIQTSSFMAPGFALRKNEIIPMVTRISSYSPLWRSKFGRGNKLSYKLLDWMEKKCVIDADATFSPSEFMIDVYSSNMGFKPKLIRTPTLYNKIKEDYSTYNNFLQKKKYLLYFGQLSRIKGVDLFIDIIPKILYQFNDIFFVIVGRDDGLPNGKSLVHCISESSKNYSKRIIIRPSLNKSQLYPIIKNSFGVIMPSRVDNYPNACLEAQSFGIPVVGTYGSSLDEMIIDEETGYLARNGDVNSLYEAIIKLLTLNKKEMNHMKARIINLRKERSSVFFDLLDYYKNIKRIVE